MKIWQFLNKNNWTKDAFARNKSGRGCSIASPDAVCFCLFGAFTKVYGQEVNEFSFFIKEEILIEINKLGFSCMSEFNDDPKTDFNKVWNLVKGLDV